MYCPMIFGVLAVRPARPVKPAACLIIWNHEKTGKQYQNSIIRLSYPSKSPYFQALSRIVPYSHSTARPYHLVIIRTLNSLSVQIIHRFHGFQTVLEIFVAIL